MDTQLDLDAIEARAKAADKGPWTTQDGECGDEYGEDWPISDGFGQYICASPDDGVRGGHSRANAEFIAHARTDVPALVAALRASDQRMTTLENRIRYAHGDRDCGCGPDETDDRCAVLGLEY